MQENFLPSKCHIVAVRSQAEAGDQRLVAAARRPQSHRRNARRAPSAAGPQIPTRKDNQKVLLALESSQKLQTTKSAFVSAAAPLRNASATNKTMPASSTHSTCTSTSICKLIQMQNTKTILVISLLLIVVLAASPSAPAETFILRDQKLVRANQSAALKASLGPTGNSTGGGGGRRQHFSLTKSSLVPLESASSSSIAGPGSQQLSITPRVSLVRLPVESNALLKCLISSSSSSTSSPNYKLGPTTKFQVRWSRFMYDESVYEQLESVSPLDEPAPKSRRSPQEGPLFDRRQQMRDFLARSKQETNAISDMLLEATLSISPVKATDNASYYCTALADDGQTQQSRARIDLVALSKPIVQLERIRPARDSKSAIVYWLVLSDGNTPIKRTILMIRNETLSNSARHQQHQQRPNNWRPTNQQQQAAIIETSTDFSSIVIDSDHNQWNRIDVPGDGLPADNIGFPESGGAPESGADNLLVRADVDVTSAEVPTRWSPPSQTKRRSQRFLNVTSLLPGVTYSFRLAAVNDMGQSNWSYYTTTMPNELPAQISEVFLLSRTNDSMAIGWRRPLYDTSKTIRYEMQLFDLNRTLTLDANTNSSANMQRTNFMYIFVGLNPGTDYHFHVRACSKAGCSAYSSPKLLASTLDGQPDEPNDVELQCLSDTNNLIVTWLPPINTRGQLLNYSVTVESQAKFVNESGKFATDEWHSTADTSDNHTLNFEANGILQPNTNYTVKVCANNRSGHCGRQSLVTPRAQCQTAPALPAQLPSNTRLVQRQTFKDKESLVLEMPPPSQRNGSIDCVQVVLIKLPKSFNRSSSLASLLPTKPSDIPLHSRSGMDPNQKLSQDEDAAAAATAATDGFEAYLAEEIDLHLTKLNPDDEMINAVLGDGTRRRCSKLQQADNSTVFDRMLQPEAFYTAFLKFIIVVRNNETQPEMLVKYSNYLAPVKTGDNLLDASQFLDNDDDSNQRADKLASLFNFSDPNFNIQHSATALFMNVGSNFGKFYNKTSTFVKKNVKLDTISEFIMRSSPAMQLLQVAIIVVTLTLLLLSFIYLLSLPASVKRKRKLKMKRKLQKHQDSVAASELNNQKSDANQASVQLGAMQQQVEPVQVEPTYQPQARQQECPIHSPMRIVTDNGPANSLRANKQAVHICQAPMSNGTMQPPEVAPGFNVGAAYGTVHERNCRTMRRLSAQNGSTQLQLDLQTGESRNFTLSQQQNSVLALAKKINKPLPIRLFGTVFECRLRNGWLREEYEQLPRQPFVANPAESKMNQLKLHPLIVSKNEKYSALISGGDYYDASLVRLNSAGGEERQMICAKSPLDADSVWDFWRLVYEQQVSTIVMLTQNEDPNTGELKCAHYGPNHDNEITTILSPRDDFVKKSKVLPGKFKIIQETIEEESTSGHSFDTFKIRRLTLLVMTTKASENSADEDHAAPEVDQPEEEEPANGKGPEEDQVIVERDILQLQFYHWNASTAKNQTRLIKFIETANERHAKCEMRGPMLIHCVNGLGRSGLFAGMSFIIEDLAYKLQFEHQQTIQQPQQEQQVQKLNLFQLVSRLRSQREMLLNSYRLYELLYQLTLNCIPNQDRIRQQFA